MKFAARFFTRIGLFAFAMIASSCGIMDLKDDLEEVTEGYGYLKGRASGVDDDSDILVALLSEEADGATIVTTRSVSVGEEFFILVPNGTYTLVAFSDSNSDFSYQPGEPAARIGDPTINWFRDMEGQERVDYAGLEIQPIELANATVLDQRFDLSLSGLHANSNVAKNFLRVVTWDDDAFSAENMDLGMWRPGAFQEQVGFGLYVLQEFDPARKTILFVHGIYDTPRRFMPLVEDLPPDYQALLFHYPSSFPLEYTSYVLSEALDELVRRYELPQVDVIAHSMGGLVSKGMIYQADETLRQRMRVFVSMASPYGGHTAAAAGLKWSPVIAPVWWAMAPGSSYLATIDGVDLTNGPEHHLIYTYSQETGGPREEDDGVVSVESQLADSAQNNAVAQYGVADNHVGVVRNSCVKELIKNIFSGDSGAAVTPGCEFE
jgi:pimeloyl-ACP methyl ester carboxylesterase